MLLTLTALGKTVLLVVAVTFIVFAFVVAIVIPRKHPRFPRNLSAFIAVCVLLFLAQMGAVLWVTSTQEVEHEETTHETTPGETETTPGGTETTPTETTEPAPGGGGDVAAGKEVFEASGCASCHTLADAGAAGTIGPNLDESKPAAELVVDRVTNGAGAMPSFSDSLDEQQIADVAAYVSTVAGT